MARQVTNRQLLKQMMTYFPDRWEVAEMKSRFAGEEVSGTIKIHCLEDDKLFLSDFSARLDPRGKITDLNLDGVKVGKFVGRMHQA